MSFNLFYFKVTFYRSNRWDKEVTLPSSTFSSIYQPRIAEIRIHGVAPPYRVICSAMSETYMLERQNMNYGKRVKD